MTVASSPSSSSTQPVRERPKLMAVYGTRPEAIKMAPLIAGLQASDDFELIVAVTAQHREMLDQVNEHFGIHPDVDLNLMTPGQNLNTIMSRVIAGLDETFATHEPDAVIVQGDTTTVTAAAIAAFNRGIQVVHLEAGLRSGDLLSPFPEEANRKLVSQIAQLHLAPTSESRDNLLHDGVAAENIAVTGNTVIDALQWTIAQPAAPLDDEALQSVLDAQQPIVLLTTHRRENLGSAMQHIGAALARLARSYPAVQFVWPAHRNPRVRELVLPAIEGLPNVTVTEPLGYANFARVLQASTVILTDSGGVQEEAPSLGRPVLVLRENTERPEAVTAGTVKLIGTEEDRIVSEVTTLLEDSVAYEQMANAVNPYGDGLATQRSIAALNALFGLGDRMPDFGE
ncbi:non-hydrolyzing UDP-N-acetylglucosamine 2-epimerase [Humidisolicoccus flavus]|uniref:non-hydrolyzing UDP-N-acetylglucosamine 2-epimerase n=1 Tax=Humidisolicoccus flavus TaxID=3111414 RepID=UPI0032526972